MKRQRTHGMMAKVILYLSQLSKFAFSDIPQVFAKWEWDFTLAPGGKAQRCRSADLQIEGTMSCLGTSAGLRKKTGMCR